MTPAEGTRTRGEPTGLPEEGVEIVASLAVHRALSTRQVRDVHMPGAGVRWSQRVLARLAAAGLADHTRATRPSRRLWFATDEGIRVAVEAGVLPRAPRQTTAQDARGPLQAHTAAVNEAGIAFLRAARERGEDFGPLAWRHEVAHPLRPGARGRRARWLIADALLTYLRLTDEEVLIEQRFLEADRATLPVDAMASELARYAELCRREGQGRPTGLAVALPGLPRCRLRPCRRLPRRARAPPRRRPRPAAGRTAADPHPGGLDPYLPTGGARRPRALRADLPRAAGTGPRRRLAWGREGRCHDHRPRTEEDGA